MRATISAIRMLLPGCLLISLIAQEPPKIKGRSSNYLPPAMRAASDPVQVDPVHYRLEIETDGMRVTRLTLGPDEAAPVVYFQDAVVVCANECHVRLGLPKLAILKEGATEPAYSGNQMMDVHMEGGSTRVIGAGMRSVANLSTHPVEMLFIERKELAADSK
jgi:hypothetical protein